MHWPALAWSKFKQRSKFSRKLRYRDAFEAKLEIRKLEPRRVLSVSANLELDVLNITLDANNDQATVAVDGDNFLITDASGVVSDSVAVADVNRINVSDTSVQSLADSQTITFQDEVTLLGSGGISLSISGIELVSLQGEYTLTEQLNVFGGAFDSSVGANDFSSVSIRSGEDVSLLDINDIDLQDLEAANLTVVAGGSIIQSDIDSSIQVSGQASFETTQSAGQVAIDLFGDNDINAVEFIVPESTEISVFRFKNLAVDDTISSSAISALPTRAEFDTFALWFPNASIELSGGDFGGTLTVHDEFLILAGVEGDFDGNGFTNLSISSAEKLVTDAEDFQLNVDAGRSTVIASGEALLADDATNQWTVAGQSFFASLGTENSGRVFVGGAKPSAIPQDSLATVNFGSLGLLGQTVVVYEDSATHLDGVRAFELGLVSTGDVTHSGIDTGAGTTSVVVADEAEIRVLGVSSVYLSRASTNPSSSQINDGRLLENDFGAAILISSTETSLADVRIRNTSAAATLPQLQGITTVENLELWFTDSSIDLAQSLVIENNLTAIAGVDIQNRESTSDIRNPLAILEITAGNAAITDAVQTRMRIGGDATFLAASNITLADNGPLNALVVEGNAEFSVLDGGTIAIGIRDPEIAGTFVPLGEAVFGSVTISAPTSQVAVFEDGRLVQGEEVARLPGDLLLTGANSAASLELQAPDRILDDLQARSAVDGGSDVAANPATTLQVSGQADFTATDINLGASGADLISVNEGRLELGTLKFHALSSAAIFEDATMLLAGASDAPSVTLQSVGSMAEHGVLSSVNAVTLVDADTQATVAATTANFQIVDPELGVPIDIDLLGRNEITSATIDVITVNGGSTDLRDLRFRNVAADVEVIDLPVNEFEDVILWSDNADIDLAATSITTRGDLLLIAGLVQAGDGPLPIKASGQNFGNEEGVFLQTDSQPSLVNFASSTGLGDDAGDITDLADVDLVVQQRGLFFAANDIVLQDNSEDAMRIEQSARFDAGGNVSVGVADLTTFTDSGASVVLGELPAGVLPTGELSASGSTVWIAVDDDVLIGGDGIRADKLVLASRGDIRQTTAGVVEADDARFSVLTPLADGSARVDIELLSGNNILNTRFDIPAAVAVGDLKFRNVTVGNATIFLPTQTELDNLVLWYPNTSIELQGADAEGNTLTVHNSVLILAGVAGELSGLEFTDASVSASAKQISDADGFGLIVDGVVPSGGAAGNVQFVASGDVLLADHDSNLLSVAGQSFVHSFAESGLIEVGVAESVAGEFADSGASVNLGSLGLLGATARIFEDSGTHLDGVVVDDLLLSTTGNITQSGLDTGAGTEAVVVTALTQLQLRSTPDDETEPSSSVYLARASSDSEVNDGVLVDNVLAGPVHIDAAIVLVENVHLRNASSLAATPIFNEGAPTELVNFELWHPNSSIELGQSLVIKNDLLAIAGVDIQNPESTTDVRDSLAILEISAESAAITDATEARTLVGGGANFVAASSITLADADQVNAMVVEGNAALSVLGTGEVTVGIRDAEVGGAFVPLGEAVFGSLTILAPTSQVAIFEDGRMVGGEDASRLPGDLLLTGANEAASLELQAPDRILDDLQGQSAVDGSLEVPANADTSVRVSGAADFTATEVNLGIEGADFTTDGEGRIEFGTLNFHALSGVSIREDATMVLTDASDATTVILQSLGSMIEQGSPTTENSVVVIDPDTQATVKAEMATFQVLDPTDSVPIDIDLLGRNEIGSTTFTVITLGEGESGLRDLRFRNIAAGIEATALPASEFEDLILWNENADIELAETSIATRGDMLFIAGFQRGADSNLQVKVTGANPAEEVGIFLETELQSLIDNFDTSTSVPSGQGNISDLADVDLFAQQRGVFLAANDILIQDDSTDSMEVIGDAWFSAGGNVQVGVQPQPGEDLPDELLDSGAQVEFGSLSARGDTVRIIEDSDVLIADDGIDVANLQLGSRGNIQQTASGVVLVDETGELSVFSGSDDGSETPRLLHLLSDNNILTTAFLVIEPDSVSIGDLKFKNQATAGAPTDTLEVRLPSQAEFDNLALWFPNASIQLDRSDFSDETLTVRNGLAILAGVEGDFAGLDRDFADVFADDEAFLDSLTISTVGAAITDSADFALNVDRQSADSRETSAVFVASGDITLADSEGNQLTVVQAATFNAGRQIELGVNSGNGNRGADSGATVAFGALNYEIKFETEDQGAVTVFADDSTSLKGANLAQSLVLTAAGNITNQGSASLSFVLLDPNGEVFARLNAIDGDILLGEGETTFVMPGEDDFLSLQANNAALEIDSDVNLRSTDDFAFLIGDTLFISSPGNIFQVGNSSGELQADSAAFRGQTVFLTNTAFRRFAAEVSGATDISNFADGDLPAKLGDVKAGDVKAGDLQPIDQEYIVANPQDPIARFDNQPRSAEQYLDVDDEYGLVLSNRGKLTVTRVQAPVDSLIAALVTEPIDGITIDAGHGYIEAKDAKKDSEKDAVDAEVADRGDITFQGWTVRNPTDFEADVVVDVLGGHVFTAVADHRLTVVSPARNVDSFSTLRTTPPGRAVEPVLVNSQSLEDDADLMFAALRVTDNTRPEGRQIGTVTNVNTYFSFDEQSPFTVAPRRGPLAVITPPTEVRDANAPTSRFIDDESRQNITIVAGSPGETNLTVVLAFGDFDRGQFTDERFDPRGPLSFVVTNLIGDIVQDVFVTDGSKPSGDSQTTLDIGELRVFELGRYVHAFDDLFVQNNPISPNLPTTITVFNDPLINLFEGASEDIDSLNRQGQELGTNGSAVGGNFVLALSPNFVPPNPTRPPEPPRRAFLPPPAPVIPPPTVEFIDPVVFDETRPFVVVEVARVEYGLVDETTLEWEDPVEYVDTDEWKIESENFVKEIEERIKKGERIEPQKPQWPPGDYLIRRYDANGQELEPVQYRKGDVDEPPVQDELPDEVRDDQTDETAPDGARRALGGGLDVAANIERPELASAAPVGTEVTESVSRHRRGLAAAGVSIAFARNARQTTSKSDVHQTLAETSQSNVFSRFQRLRRKTRSSIFS